jgi:hypothetical protein
MTVHCAFLQHTFSSLFQHSENSLLSDDQWDDLFKFFANPDLRVAILCSETPFVGDEPGKYLKVLSHT